MDTTPSNPGGQGSSVPPAPAQSPDSTAVTKRPADNEGLPEYEPLTPELVEDEAVRGDFMLRWAAILVATLLGWTEISESLTLVRIKTGQYLASNGFLPPANDVFSVSASQQPWLNFSWLNDLLLAGVYGIGGDVALTVLGALLAGASFYCVLATSRAGVSSWWTSICAVLAALAAFPLLRPGPDSIAVLGLALLMLVLMKGEERPDSARYWLLIPLLWLWSNLDGHAFLGFAVLSAYALGDMLDARRAAIKTRGTAWIYAMIGVLAMFVHPFHIWVTRAPQWTYGLAAREQRLYAGDGADFDFLPLNLLDRAFWQQLNVFTLAGVLVAAAALLSLLLNRRAARFSHAIAWLAATALTLVSVHALLAASVVYAVLAGVNGQEWYRRGFRQTYSVETGEVLFSRGGRAVTVVALFALAYLAVSGRLMGANGRRIGAGFDNEISTTTASFAELAADSYDDRAFNFNPSQGDALIWVGQKPFVDSRFDLYAGARPNLCDLHRKLRLAMRQKVSGDDRTGQRATWHAAFSEYKVSHVLPRLSGARPNYETFFDLLTDPEREWRLVKIDAASAVLYWNRPNDAELAAYIAARPGADFMKLAFPPDAKDDPEPLPPIPPPRPPTWYDRLLILPKPALPNEIQLARHYTNLRSALASRIRLEDGAALTMLGIRHARKGLAAEPNSAEAYQVLAASYLGLSDMERVFDPSGSTTSLRMRQALAACHQAVKCNPDDAAMHMTLFQVLSNTGKTDLALLHLREVERINGAPTLNTDNSQQAREEGDRNREVLTETQAQIDNVQTELRLSLASDTSRLEVVQSALSRGLPGEALRLLEEDQTIVAQNTSVQMLMADLLLDAGRIEDAVNQLESMAAVMLKQAPAVVSRWRGSTVVANIAAGNYDRARELLEEDVRAATELRLQSILGTSPSPGQTPGMSTAPFTHSPDDMLDSRSLLRSTIAADLLFTYPQQIGRDEFLHAVCDLEDGRNQAVAQRLINLVEQDPECELRSLALFYVAVITGKRQQFDPPSQEIPVWKGLIAEDSADDAAAVAPVIPDTSSDGARDATVQPEEAADPPPPPVSDRSATEPTP